MIKKRKTFMNGPQHTCKSKMYVIVLAKIHESISKGKLEGIENRIKKSIIFVRNCLIHIYADNSKFNKMIRRKPVSDSMKRQHRIIDMRMTNGKPDVIPFQYMNSVQVYLRLELGNTNCTVTLHYLCYFSPTMTQNLKRFAAKKIDGFEKCF